MREVDRTATDISGAPRRAAVYAQRPEDRVLRALVRKSETIRKELGSLAAVLEERLSNTIRTGIRHDEADKLAAEIEAADLDKEKRATADEELETSRERHSAGNPPAPRPNTGSVRAVPGC